MRVIGVDLGSKRVGIAMTDASGTLASPHTVLERSKNLYREISAIVDEWEVETVVVGLPLSLDGSVGPAAQRALAETKSLRDLLSVPVETYDERLTTVSADRYLAEAGLNAKKRRSVIDMAAAAIILEGWLDQRRHSAQQPAAQNPAAQNPASQNPAGQNPIEAPSADSPETPND